MKYKKKLTLKLNKLIPGGAHTYSRGSDQFSYNAPELLVRGKGPYVFNEKNKKFLDYGMGLRSITLGYADRLVNNAALKQINHGNNLTLPSMVELNAAEKIVKHFKSVDMVKFTKNGSTAVTAAVKISRGYTGKKIILRCSDHPFFSYDDWFIGSTEIKKGIPKEISNLTKKFKYNDLNDLKKQITKYKNEIACIILEPSTKNCPYDSSGDLKCCGTFPCNKNFKKKNFLLDVQNICKENNIVFILDEMITGFRWHLYGAQNMYGIDPDISTFGKGMANGFPLACVAGKSRFMEEGGINRKNKERLFLLSTTHGAEMSSLGAFIKTLEIYKKNNVTDYLWKYGNELKKIFNEESSNLNLENFLVMKGVPCSPYYECKDIEKKNNNEFTTLLMQEMIKNNILWPSFISISFSHKKKEIAKTRNALKKAFLVYKKALKEGVKKYLIGPPIKPVFRKFN